MLLWLAACFIRNKNNNDTDAPHELAEVATTSIQDINTEPQSFTIDGFAENAYSTKDGDYIIWGENWNQQDALWRGNVQDDTAPQPLENVLPEGEQRSYNKPLLLENGNLAICYQSTKGFDGQDGTQHGFVVIDPKTGKKIQDVKFDSSTNPEGLVESDGLLYVLCSNRVTDQIPSIAVYAYDTTSESFVFANEEFLTDAAAGTGDMAVFTDQDNQTKLAVSLTSVSPTTYNNSGKGGVVTNTESGALLVIDPDQLQIESYHTTAPSMGMSLAWDEQNQLLLLSGVETENTDYPFGTVDPALPDGQSFVGITFGELGLQNAELFAVGAGGIFPAGIESQNGGFFMSALLASEDGPLLAIWGDPTTSQSVTHELEASIMNSPIIQAGANHMVMVAGGTDMNAASQFVSTVYVF